MDQIKLSIILKPWFYVDKTIEYMTRYCFNHTIKEIKEIKEKKKVTLITLAYVGQDCLHSLANFIIQPTAQEDSDIQVLAYSSQPFAINNQYFQILYIPSQSSSSYSTSKQALTHILKYHSQHTLTPCHHNHLKPKTPVMRAECCSLSYILVNCNQIYEVNYIENRMQLSKKIQIRTTTNDYNLIEAFTKINGRMGADLGQIEKIMNMYFQVYECMLNNNNNDRNWINFTTLVLGHSYLNAKLEQSSSYKAFRKEESLYLSVKQMNQIEEELQTMNPYEVNCAQYQLFKTACRNIINGLRQENSLNCNTFLQGLKDSFDKLTITSQAQLNQQTSKLKPIFHNYKIQPQYLPYITEHQQISLQTLHHNSLNFQNIHLKHQLSQLHSQLQQKQQNIQQYHKQILTLQHFKDSINVVKLNLKQICDKYQQKQQDYDCLSQSQEDLKLLLQTSQMMNQTMENKCSQLTREKKELLLSIKEMTKEHLHLITQIGGLKEEIKILEDKLEESQHIEARALSSLQNQAEIKVRLNRYQHYVNQLKQSMHTFKKLQIQKFNYILTHNAKQHSLLKQSQQKCKKELLFKDKKIRQLQEVIECQKIRIDYFQKMYISNYHNDTIYEVSQENSATDREINAN